MSHGGGGESLNESGSGSRKRRRKNDEFPQAIARIAVAQVCESVGLGFQQSTLDAFSDVVCKYIHEIGKTSSFYANVAGRSECNVFDLVQGLEDLSGSQGFVGASERDHCLSESGIVKELSRFVNFSEEIGFAYSVPSFPVVKERKSTPSFLQSGETPLSDVIPPWLPKFPESEAYTNMPVPNTEVAQTTTDKIEQKEKVVEPTSSEPQQHLVQNESLLPVAAEQGDIGGLRGTNPFLVAPLQPGEKDVSLVPLPAKLKEENMLRNHNNHILELDASVPENKVVENGGRDTEGGVRKVVTNNRPTARMKFCIGKKSLDNRIRHNDKGKEKVAVWFSNDEVRDDEEKRTEKHPSVPMDIEEHIANDSVVN